MKKVRPRDSFWISLVDSCSIFIAIQLCYIKIKAISDCGSSVSFPGLEIFDELCKTKAIKQQRRNKHRKPVNGLPTGVKRFIKVLPAICTKHFEHDFHVFENTDSDCLLGSELEFVEGKQCDALFFLDALETQSFPLPSDESQNFQLSDINSLSSGGNRKFFGARKPYQKSSSTYPQNEGTTCHPQNCLGVRMHFLLWRR